VRQSHRGDPTSRVRIIFVPGQRVVFASAYFLAPLRGWRFLGDGSHGLRPWAAFFRRFAAFLSNSYGFVRFEQDPLRFAQGRGADRWVRPYAGSVYTGYFFIRCQASRYFAYLERWLSGVRRMSGWPSTFAIGRMYQVLVGIT